MLHIAHRSLLPLSLVVLALGPGCSDDGNDPSEAAGGDVDSVSDAPDTAPTPDAPPPAPACFAGGPGEAASPLEPTDSPRRHTLGDRSFELFVPAGLDTSKPVPLVLNFHGATPTFIDASESHALIAEMNAAATRDGYVVAYPQALVFGDTQRWQYASESSDVDFVDALLAELSAKLCVDPDRIYSTGFSSGAVFSYILACVRSEVFAAIAPVAGNLEFEGCEPPEPVAIIAFHGTEDQRNSYEAAVSTIDVFASLGGCSAETETVYQKGDATCVARVGCAPGRAVRLCTIDGGGHTWPGSAQSEAILTAFGEGKTSQDIDANQEMWSFFGAGTGP